MKINGFQVEEHGSGFEITLRLHVGREEGDLGSLLAGFISEDLPRVLFFAGAHVSPAPEDRASETRDNAAEAPAPASRRRRSAAADPTPPAGGTEETTQPAPAATGDAPAAAPGSRRRRASAEPVATSAAPSKITDEDLSKAASMAAVAVKPGKVMSKLAEFNVSKVNELVGDDRQKFLDWAREVAA